MREPPEELDDDRVVETLRDGFGLPVAFVAHLPVGFGAHHWAAYVGDARAYFVTYDRWSGRHDRDSLDRAYGAAGSLDLDFVLAPLPTIGGGCVVPVARGALSVTPWSGGTGAGGIFSEADAAGTADLLGALHTHDASDLAIRPPGWRPLVTEDFADALAGRLTVPWRAGPMAARVHDALVARQAAVEVWTARYHALAARTDPATWVLTHGEPGGHNQLFTTRGRQLIDWESLKCAPRERDFASLLSTGTGWCPTYGRAIGAGPDWRPDWAAVEMFDLEWRLDEISQYADRFEAEHRGTESDRIAVGGLLHELGRPDWRQPGHARS